MSVGRDCLQTLTIATCKANKYKLVFRGFPRRHAAWPLVLESKERIPYCPSTPYNNVIHCSTCFLADLSRTVVSIWCGQVFSMSTK